jgi:1-acyl-sn-glycerol-3-phosphate acyltransferase
LFEKPLIGKFFKKIGAFPVDRDGKDMSALKTCVKILKDNEVLGIFPEGTRSKTGKLGEFKEGATTIATLSNKPIIPIKIEGNYKLFSKITLKIGEPIYPTKENKKTLKDILYKTILEL